MIVFRLAKQRFADDLSGVGAELTGGRWNFKGTRILYTSESRALCMAEVAVHIPIGLIPKDYYLITIEIPDNSPMTTIDVKTLPKNWKEFPYSDLTQRLGDDFLNKMDSLILKVPSAVVPGDWNYLINPDHADFKEIRIKDKESFNFDSRLFR